MLMKLLLYYNITPKDAAEVITKVLKSAVANAENNSELDVDNLYVASVCCKSRTNN